jgi:hypothetical protein
MTSYQLITTSLPTQMPLFRLHAYGANMQRLPAPNRYAYSVKVVTMSYEERVDSEGCSTGMNKRADPYGARKNLVAPLSHFDA